MLFKILLPHHAWDRSAVSTGRAAYAETVSKTPADASILAYASVVSGQPASGGCHRKHVLAGAVE
jgi:hypothetical protein